MKRQTRLTPAEGGRFAGPVGSPVPPNAADMGLATDEQVDAANGTMRRLNQMLEEHGCEMLANQGMYQWLVIKGDRVLMRIGRAQVELARLEETRAIVEEVVRRDAASAEDALEMLDEARASENHTSVLLDATRRERDELNEVVKALRAKMEELAIWKSHRLDCDQRAHDYDLDAGQCRHCHVQLSDEDWTVMREATGRAAPSQLARTVERTVRMAADRGFITKQAEKRKEVGRLEDITGGPSDRSVGADFAMQRFMHGVGAKVEESSRHGCLICDPCKECSCGPYSTKAPDVLPAGGMSLNEVAQRFFENHDKGLDLYGRPTWRGVPVIADDSLPDGKIYAVPAGHEWKVLTPPKPTIVADPPLSYKQVFEGRDLRKECEKTRLESKEVLQRAFDHAYPKEIRVLEDGRHLIDKAEAVMIGGMKFTMPVRGFYDVSIRHGRPHVHIHEEEEG